MVSTTKMNRKVSRVYDCGAEVRQPAVTHGVLAGQHAREAELRAA